MSKESPLTEAVPESLDALFAKDPLKLTKSDLTDIVKALRAQRERLMTAEAAGKRPPSTKSKSSAKSTLSLEDLGL